MSTPNEEGVSVRETRTKTQRTRVSGLDPTRRDESQDAASDAAMPDGNVIAKLAALSPLQYERLRKQKASELGCRGTVLDKLVQQKRAKVAARALQGHEVQLTEIEPWSEPVDGAKVLDAIAETFMRYIVLPPGAANVAALWCAHTHCFELFLCSPRLNVSSPEKQCGKSTLLDVIALFAPKPVETENLSTAVLFRLIDAEKPVILADEYDSWITSNEELRGILNAGHRQGAMVYRCEGENNEVRGFKAYAPVVLSGIGALPGTLHDRSIVIRLERAKRGELKERFDSRRTNREQELCRKLSRWSQDNRHTFESRDPKMPDGAFNRLADNWRPLFAIAEIAGGDWPKRVAEAFARLTSSDDLDAQGLGTVLLADIAEIFQKEGTDRLPSFELSEMLAAIEGRPWAEWGKQRKGISPNQLAIQLRRFGVFPKGIRVGDETPRGYDLAGFKEAFERYLPAPSLSECNSATTLRKTLVSEVQHPDGMLHPENASYTRECCGVAPCTGEALDLDTINHELAAAAGLLKDRQPDEEGEL
jgi:putative DNA primase/helicase